MEKALLIGITFSLGALVIGQMVAYGVEWLGEKIIEIFSKKK